MKGTISLIGCMLMAASTSLFVVLADEGKSSDPFRQEHIEIKKHLNLVAKSLDELVTQKETEQRKTMTETVAFFKKDIRPHAEWEEKVLYPAVDKRTGAPKYPFTTTMRYDHKIVGRLIDELDQQALAKKPEGKNFVRLADRLLGLLSAHFEKEEEVLLPILDKTMSKHEFNQEIMRKH